MFCFIVGCHPEEPGALENEIMRRCGALID